MVALLCFFLTLLASPFKSKSRLEAENAALRHQVIVLNHAPHIAATDLFVVPTIGFGLLYVLVIVRLARRELVWFNVTPHPTAEWIAQKLPKPSPGMKLRAT